MNTAMSSHACRHSMVLAVHYEPDRHSKPAFTCGLRANLTWATETTRHPRDNGHVGEEAGDHGDLGTQAGASLSFLAVASIGCGWWVCGLWGGR